MDNSQLTEPNLEDCLLEALLLAIAANESVENSQYVPAVFDDAIEDVAEIWLALGFTVPFGENRGRNLDIATQLLRRVPTQE